MSVSLIDGHIDDDAPRMTDNDVIKALECCVEDDSLCADSMACRICPMNNNYNCTFELRIHTLDLINRQKAEIERLQNAYKKCAWERDVFAEDMKEEIKKDCSYLALDINTIKAEAVKEFAERLNKEAENVGIDREGDFLYSDSDNTAFEIYNTVAEWCNEVANTILKEMVGDTE